VQTPRHGDPIHSVRGLASLALPLAVTLAPHPPLAPLQAVEDGDRPQEPAAAAAEQQQRAQQAPWSVRLRRSAECSFGMSIGNDMRGATDRAHGSTRGSPSLHMRASPLHAPAAWWRGSLRGAEGDYGHWLARVCACLPQWWRCWAARPRPPVRYTRVRLGRGD
jgi:hypothetical protein